MKDYCQIAVCMEEAKHDHEIVLLSMTVVVRLCNRHYEIRGELI